MHGAFASGGGGGALFGKESFTMPHQTVSEPGTTGPGA